MNSTEHKNSSGNSSHTNTTGTNIDIVNSLNPSEDLMHKMTSIKDTIGGKVGVKRANQFQKAWKRVSTYSDVAERDAMYNKLANITYAIGADGVVGIKGITGVDRPGKLYSVEPATKQLIMKTLGNYYPHLFYKGGGIKENSHGISVFDMEKSKIDCIRYERKEYLITVDEITALSQRANNDGQVVMDLMNITPEEGEHYTHIWAAEDDIPSIRSQYTLCISNTGDMIFPGWADQKRYCYIYGYQNEEVL